MREVRWFGLEREGEWEREKNDDRVREWVRHVDMRERERERERSMLIGLKSERDTLIVLESERGTLILIREWERHVDLG